MQQSSSLTLKNMNVCNCCFRYNGLVNQCVHRTIQKQYFIRHDIHVPKVPTTLFESVLYEISG
jgi:hypothetical protein